RARTRVVGRDTRALDWWDHLPALCPPSPARVQGDHDPPAADGVRGTGPGVRRGVPVLPEAVRRRRVIPGDVTDAPARSDTAVYPGHAHVTAGFTARVGDAFREGLRARDALGRLDERKQHPPVRGAGRAGRPARIFLTRATALRALQGRTTGGPRCTPS